jgi:RsiW-degrading membrane proteinase PrsW (M82 family)
MLVVTCPCGKQVYGSEAMAGESAQCMTCRRMVNFPAPPGQKQPAAPPVTPLDLGLDLLGEAVAPSQLAEKTPTPAAEQAVEPSGRRLPCEWVYWLFLLTLAPLVLTLFHDKDDIKKRLERTVAAHPEIKQRFEELKNDPQANVEDLFKLLPGRRIDERALLPRDSQNHWLFAGLSITGFFVVVGLVMAWRVTSSWMLVLAGLFTATFGIGFLLLLQDYMSGMYVLVDTPDDNFLIKLVGFTFGVGLCEELSKALPVLFYIRTFKRATWRGACVWGMASGVAFGVAEGLLYSATKYNGVSGADTYLMRFLSCVTLHGLWSASVGITIFHARKLVGQVLGAMLYGGDWTRSEVALAALRVLGVAMALHGLYDTFLTVDMIPMALLIALFSFAWLGWQIEDSREKDLVAAGLKMTG